MTYLLILGARNNSVSRVFTKKDIEVIKDCIEQVLPESGYTLLKGTGGWFQHGKHTEEHSRLVLISIPEERKAEKLMDLFIATFQQSSVMLVPLGEARFHDGRRILRGVKKAKPRHERFDEVDL